MGSDAFLLKYSYDKRGSLYGQNGLLNPKQKCCKIQLIQEKQTFISEIWNTRAVSLTHIAAVFSLHLYSRWLPY